MNLNVLESVQSMTPQPTNSPSEASASSSTPPSDTLLTPLVPTLPCPLLPENQSSTEYNEAPLLTINPTGKPLVEMTQDELAKWHAELTQHIQSPQTLQAHVRAPRAERVSTKVPPVDKYV